MFIGIGERVRLWLARFQHEQTDTKQKTFIHRGVDILILRRIYMNIFDLKDKQWLEKLTDWEKASILDSVPLLLFVMIINVTSAAKTFLGCSGFLGRG